MKFISSKKFKGVYHTELKDGDLSYYIYYRDNDGKQRKHKIGKKSEGINESYCHRIRTNTINNLKNGKNYICLSSIFEEDRMVSSP